MAPMIAQAPAAGGGITFVSGLEYTGDKDAPSGGVLDSMSMTLTAGSNKLLMIFLGLYDASTPLPADFAISSATWNTTENFTCTTLNVREGGGSDPGVYICYLWGPTVGTHDIDVSFAGVITDVSMYAMELDGVNESPILDVSEVLNENESPFTTDITTSDAGAWIVDIVYAEVDDTDGHTYGSQTERNEQSVGTGPGQGTSSVSTWAPGTATTHTVQRGSLQNSSAVHTVIALRPAS